MILPVLMGCHSKSQEVDQKSVPTENPLADEIRNETLRTWQAYVEYAWGHDNLKPLSKGYEDWYEGSLNISSIDAYSSLHLMGFDVEIQRIERYVIDSLSFDQDLDVKVFEVNIRVLGGLLNMYHQTQNDTLLQKAQDFGNRLLPAFESPTGLPYFHINLKTGQPSGETINVAEAGSYLMEFGLLSYFTQDPKYYQAAKRATKAVFERRSTIGLLGRDLNVKTGEWTVTESMAGAYVDSYLEYLYKAWVLFGDPELKTMWDAHIGPINQYLTDEDGDLLWYGKSDRETGQRTSTDITLWDAYLPGLLALSGDVDRAKKAHNAWDAVWNKHDAVSFAYDYKKDSVLNPYFQLNPEVMESAYYLWHLTGDSTYYQRNVQYFNDLKIHCRTPVAYAHLNDITTKEKDDKLATFFIAETLKYLYLTFSDTTSVSLNTHVFTTEAHHFSKSAIDKAEAQERLGF